MTVLIIGVVWRSLQTLHDTGVQTNVRNREKSSPFLKVFIIIIIIYLFLIIIIFREENNT